MSRQLGNTPFTATEKKRIFFHEPKRKYHTCRKPIEKARIEHLEEQKMQSEEEEKKRDEEKNSQLLADRSNQNNQYVTRKEFSEFKREIKSNFKKIFDKLDIDYDQ